MNRAKFLSYMLTLFLVALFTWLYYDANWSSGAKECFAKGGTQYDHSNGCKRIEVVK